MSNTYLLCDHLDLIDDVQLPAGFCLWLTKERREWLSGRFVIANWDVEELMAKKDEIITQDKLKFRMVT